MLKINVKLATTFHSETDDQSEIVNQEMKQYLRIYCNYQQDNFHRQRKKKINAHHVVR